MSANVKITNEIYRIIFDSLLELTDKSFVIELLLKHKIPIKSIESLGFLRDDIDLVIDSINDDLTNTELIDAISDDNPCIGCVFYLSEKCTNIEAKEKCNGTQIFIWKPQQNI